MAVSIGALFATAAHAQTSVTLYGIADAGFRTDHTTIGTLKSISGGGESGSRWGIRATEDLGGGLYAKFNFEQGIDLSDNSTPQGNVTSTGLTSPTSTGSRLFSRTAIVGIGSAAAGELRIGRAYTPFYILWSSIDPFGAGMVGQAQNYAVGNQTRYDNAVYYDTPKIYGFQVSGAYRLGESSTNTNTGTNASTKNGNNSGNVTLTYAAGPILAGYNYISIKNAVDNNTTRTQFGGLVYDLKVVKIHGLWFDTRNATPTKIRSYGLGVTVPIQAFAVFAQAARIDNHTPNSATSSNDATFFGLGANYSFSKRTDIYTSVAKIKNKGSAVYALQDASNFGLYTTAVGSPTSTGAVPTSTAPNLTPGFDPWSAQVGIRHRF